MCKQQGVYIFLDLYYYVECHVIISCELHWFVGYASVEISNSLSEDKCNKGTTLNQKIVNCSYCEKYTQQYLLSLV